MQRLFPPFNTQLFQNSTESRKRKCLNVTIKYIDISITEYINKIENKFGISTTIIEFTSVLKKKSFIVLRNLIGNPEPPRLSWSTRISLIKTANFFLRPVTNAKFLYINTAGQSKAVFLCAEGMVTNERK